MNISASALDRRDMEVRERAQSFRPRLWRILERPTFQSGHEYLRALEEANVDVCDWTRNVVSRADFPINNVTWPLPLVRVRMDDFGIVGQATLRDFWEGASAAGLELAPVEAALALRLAYGKAEQPKHEWLRVAVPFDSMVDDDGIPHLPKLGHALGRLRLHTYWANPGGMFYSTNEFVCIDRRLA